MAYHRLTGAVTREEFEAYNASGVTQKQLAVMLGVSQSAISQAIAKTGAVWWQKKRKPSR